MGKIYKPTHPWVTVNITVTHLVLDCDELAVNSNIKLPFQLLPLLVRIVNLKCLTNKLFIIISTSHCGK